MRLGKPSFQPRVEVFGFPRAPARYAIAFTLALIAAAAAAPMASAQTPPQFVYTVSTMSHKISGFQLNPTTGALTPVPNSPFEERLAPSALAVNPAGTLLFIANGADNDVSVFKIDPATGALTEAANSPFTAGNGTSPTVLTTDPSGKFLYVGNASWNPSPMFGEIDAYTINPLTGDLTPTPVSSPPPNAGIIFSPNPTGVYAHPNGHWIYFLGGTGGSSIDNVLQGFVIDPNTGDIGNFIPQYRGIAGASGLAGDPAGRFIFDGWGETCARITQLQISSVDGSLTPGPTYDSTNQGCGVLMRFPAVDSSGTFLYSDAGSFFAGTLAPIDASFPGSQTNLPNGPWAADPLGPFVFTANATFSDLHVYSVNLITGALADVPGSPVHTGFSIDAIVVTGTPNRVPAPVAGFSPAGLTFTNTTVGVPSAPQMIMLVNSGTAPLAIAGISVIGVNHSDFGQTNNCPASLAAGTNCTVTVTYTPSTTAAETASINVADNAAGSPQAASLTAVGVIQTPPNPVPNPASLSFSLIPVGTTESQNILITNTGTQTLNISQFAMAGPNPGDFAQTNSCSGSVNGGTSCAVSVVFQPQAAGQRVAMMNVTTNGGLLGVPLSGDASAPFGMAPSGPTTQTVPPGQPANYSINFTPAVAFSGAVQFSCTVVPAGPTCGVTPSLVQVTASNNPAATPVKVTATAPAAAARQHAGFFAHRLLSDDGDLKAVGFVRAYGAIRWPLMLLTFLMLALLAKSKPAAAGSRAPRLRFRPLAAVMLVAALAAVASCGGGSSGPPPPQPQNFTVKVLATSGPATQTVNLTLTVQ